jgi:lysophospholipase L1-like esterase
MVDVGSTAPVGSTVAIGSMVDVGSMVEPLRFAALGDSLTEGLGDPLPGGAWRGWAALLAPALTADPAGVRLVNCARSGARAADVAGRQLAEALGHRPHLASVVAGANDTLRGDFDIAAVAHHLDAVLAALRAQGSELLTACLPDPGRMLGLPWPLAAPLRRRMRALNDVVHALSQRYEALHLHIADHPMAADRAAWSADRLHPAEAGHRRLARDFHALLTDAGLARGEPPAATPDGPGPNRAACARWMATKGTRWVAARCTDLLPDLLALAVQEVRHRVSGTTHLLDERVWAPTHLLGEPAVWAPTPVRQRPGTNRTAVPGVACAAAASAPSGTTPTTG